MTLGYSTFLTEVQKPKIILWAFLLLNVILKIIFIDAFPLSGDEPFTVFFAQYTFADMYEVLKVENNPPLYYLIMHFWVDLTGIDTSIARIPSLVFSVITVFYLFKLGERFYNLRVAFITSILYTFSSMHMLFSHETRVYSLFALLTAASMYYFLVYLSSTNKKPYITLFLANTLLIYAHFFGIFILFIQGLLLLYTIFKSKTIDKKIILTYAAIGLFYLPYLSILVSRLYLTSSNGTWLTPPSTPMELYYMLIKFFNMPLMALISLGTFGYAFFLYFKNKFPISVTTLTVIIWTVLPFFIMFAISYVVPMFIYRYLVFVSIGAYLLYAIATNYILTRYSQRIVLIATSAILLIMISTFDPYKEKEKRNVTEYISLIKNLKQKKPDLVVLIAPSWSYYAFTYEYNKDYFRDYKNTKKRLAEEAIYIINELGDLDPKIIANNPPIIYIDEWAELSDPKRTVYNYLKKRNQKSHFFAYGGIKLTYIP